MVVCCTSSCQPHTKNGWRQMSYCCVVISLLGVACIILGAVLPSALDKQFWNTINGATIISGPEAAGYKDWASNQEDPILFASYIIDVLNPDEVVNGSKPILAERGPYVYREYRVNNNVTWQDDGNIISYIQYKYYVFQPDLSVDDDTKTQYTSLNMPMVELWTICRTSPQYSALFYLLYHDYVPQYPPFLQFNDTNLLFTKRTPREIIFGWVDPALTLIAQAAPLYNISIPISPYYPGSVANGSYTSYVQYTGLKDIRRIRSLISIDNQTQISAWANKSGVIHGSDGSQWHRHLDPSDVLDFWYAPAYRSTPLVHEGETTYRDVPLYVYRLRDSFWLNATNYPPNANYYHFGPNGQVNLSSVLLGSPIYMSLPRMQGVDEWVRNSSELVQVIDNAATPETVFYVEPITGAAFFGETSSQANVYIEPLENVVVPGPNGTLSITTWLKNVKPVYFPLFWGSESATISDSDAREFTNGIDMIKGLTKGSYYGMIPFGIILIFMGIYCTWRSRQHYYRTPYHGKAVDALMGSEDVPSDKLDTVKVDELSRQSTQTSTPVTSPYGTFKPTISPNGEFIETPRENQASPHSQ